MIQNILYHIIYGKLYALSRLPWGVLHAISNFFFFLLYHVFGYRKKVARENLRIAFPEYSEAQREAILKENYRHLADMFVEFFRSISMSREEILDRFVNVSPGVRDEIAAQPKGVIMLATHCGNFEWLITWVCVSLPQKAYGVYSKLSSPIFERLALETRQRWGGALIPMRNAIKQTVEKTQSPCVVGYICDQSPARRPSLYYTRLFGVPTAAHDRFAQMILQHQIQTYFCSIRKTARSRYALALQRLPIENYLPYSEENVARFVDDYNKILEANIRENPAIWLWTHKRWKHPPTEGDRLSPLLSKPV